MTDSSLPPSRSSPVEPRVAAGAAAAAAARVCGRVHRGKLLPRHRGPADRPRAQAQRDLHLRPEGARAVLHRRTPGGETRPQGPGGGGGQIIPGLFLLVCCT